MNTTKKLTPAEARAQGYTVDSTCYPWVAYKGERFSTHQWEGIFTDTEAELIEAQVLPGSALAGQAVRDLKLPRGALIAAVEKAGAILKPRPDTRLEPGEAGTKVPHMGWNALRIRQQHPVLAAMCAMERALAEVAEVDPLYMSTGDKAKALLGLTTLVAIRLGLGRLPEEARVLR